MRDMADLIRQAQEGDKAAKDRLIRRMISKGFPQGMIIDILADIEKNDADI